MKNLRCTFLSNGEKIKLTAIVSDDLKKLSTSKKNETNGQYEVAERAYYFEDEDCWAAKVLDKSLFDDED